MNFIRRYLAFLAPIGIVIFAVMLFVSTLLVGRSVSKEMESSIAQGRKLSSMRSKTPPKAQAEVERLYQAEHKKDADEVVWLARRSTQRELGDRYRTAVGELIKSMRALDAPSDIDIRKETGSETSGAGRAIGGRFGMLGIGRTAGAKDSSRDVIVDAVCNKRAESILVYANPNSFGWYGFWEDYKYSGFDEAIKDCWYSQVSYWIYEDVVATINKMNAGSDYVYTSPVKRLVGVSFSGPVEYFDQGRMAFAGPDEPEYVIDKSAGILSDEQWTGRICDEDIDVVHFCVSVIVDSKSFMSFIKELCSEKEHKYREGYSSSGPERIFKHNQITVLQSRIEPVDRTAVPHEYYRYGDSAVVQLSLVCEYIFNRSGYDKIKPEPVKELLGQSAAKKGALK